MIIVKVELWSAVTHKITEIARMRIANVGGTQQIGDYEAVTFFGRDKRRLDQSMLADRTTRRGTVSGHPRLREHVWHLVAKSLSAMGYGCAVDSPVLSQQVGPKDTVEQ